MFKEEKDKLFSIGQIAELFDMNVKTIRYYESVGLLKPEYINEETGYRYYSTKQFERINTIKYLRALDVPIVKIKFFFEKREVEKLVDLLHEQQQEVENQVQRLGLIRQKINCRLQQIQDARDSNWDQIYEKELPRRDIVCKYKRIGVRDDWEYYLPEIERQNDLNDVVFLGKVGFSVSKEDLRKKKYEIFSSVFVFLEPNEAFEKTYQQLPGGNYVVIRFNGTHKDSKKYYQKIFDYMKEHDYKLAGDSVEITLIDYGFTDDVSQYVTEIQVPYEK